MTNQSLETESEEQDKKPAAKANSEGDTDSEISKKVEEIFDLRPYFIEQRLKLRNPIYTETAAYGHMGRKSEWVKKTFVSSSGEIKDFEVELFTWEKLDYVEKINEYFK